MVEIEKSPEGPIEGQIEKERPAIEQILESGQIVGRRNIDEIIPDLALHNNEVEVMDIKPLPKHMEQTYLLEIIYGEQTLQAVLKQETGEHKNLRREYTISGQDIPFWRRESAAHLVDQFFGFGLTLPTVTRKIEGVNGSVRMFIPEDKATSVARQHLPEETSQEWLRLAIFDFLIGNIDRRSDNILVNKQTGKMWAIDHDLSFLDNKLIQSCLNTDEFRGPLVYFLRNPGEFQMPDEIRQILESKREDFDQLLVQLKPLIGQAGLEGMRQRYQCLLSGKLNLEYNV
jgi:hypothetical protein